MVSSALPLLAGRWEEVAEGRQRGIEGPPERTGYAACTPKSEQRKGVQKPLSSLETLYVAWDLQNAKCIMKWQGWARVRTGDGGSSGSTA